MKSGTLVLDGGVLAGVDAIGGSVAVEVDDHEDVQASNSEASLEVVPWTDLISLWILWKIGFEVEDEVEGVVSLDLSLRTKVRVRWLLL